MSFLGNTAIELGSNLLGGLFNTGIGMAASKSLMRYQYELNQQATDRANEYNLPKNQVARLIEGGLNPNLAYSSVHSVAGSSTPNVGLGNAPSPNIRLSPLQAMAQAQGLEMAKQETRYQGARADYQELLNDQLRSKQPYFKEMAEIERLSAGFASDLLQYKKSNEWYKQEDKRRLYDILETMNQDGSLMASIRAQYASAGFKNSKMQKDMAQIDQSIRESQARIDYLQKQGKNLDERTKLLMIEEDLKRNGVTWSDNLAFRFIALVAKQLGIDIGLTSELDEPEGKNPVERGASIGGNP